MTARFPGLVLADWRARLVHDHPRLFPNARLVHTAEGLMLTARGWPDVPHGWRSVLETACVRLEAVAAEPGMELAVRDVAETRGLLRLDVGCSCVSGAGLAALDLAVDLAEARSAHVCALCGEPGRLMQRHGWRTLRCEAHSDGHVPVRRADPALQVITRTVDGRPHRLARRYDPVADAFVPAALPPDDEE